MPAMKRPAAANAQPAKLAKVVKESPPAPVVSSPPVTPFIQKCEIVAEALRASEMGSTEMLINMLPFAAQLPPRHKFQEDALAFVGHELKSELEAIKIKVAELQAKVAGVDEERNHRSAVVGAAVSAAEAKTGAHAEAKTFLASQRIVLKDAKEAAVVARAAQKKGDAELDAAAQRERTITSAMEEKTALETAAAEESNLESRAEKLRKDCHLIIEDAGLLKAATMSLGRVPEARGVFDKMVLLQFSEEMAKHLVLVQQTLAEGKPGMMARATKVQESEAVEVAANEAVMSAVVMESDVDVAKQEAEAAVKDSSANAADLSTEIEAAAVALLCAKQRLADFESGPVAAFAELQDPKAFETVPTAAECDVMPEGGATAETNFAVEGDARAEGGALAEGGAKAEGGANADVNAKAEVDVQAEGGAKADGVATVEREVMGAAMGDGNLRLHSA